MNIEIYIGLATTQTGNAWSAILLATGREKGLQGCCPRETPLTHLRATAVLTSLRRIRVAAHIKITMPAVAGNGRSALKQEIESALERHTVEWVIIEGVGTDKMLAAHNLAQDALQTEAEAPKMAVYPDIVFGIEHIADIRQYGVIGTHIETGQKIALSTNDSFAWSVIGSPGSGKSYLLGVLAELGVQPFGNGLNLVEKPLTIFLPHYHEDGHLYEPEFTSLRKPNTVLSELKILAEAYGATPNGIADVWLLVPPDQVRKRKKAYPFLTIRPICFSPAELDINAWKLLMGMSDRDTVYFSEFNRILRKHRGKLSLEVIEAELEGSLLTDAQKKLAQLRLRFASTFIDESAEIGHVVEPGRVILIDLRDEYATRAEMESLLLVLMSIFMNQRQRTGSNSLLVIDEAHKLTQNKGVVLSTLIRMIRERRHYGLNLVLASQSPLHPTIHELCDAICICKAHSPEWLKYVQKYIAPLRELTPAKVAHLKPGQAYLWTAKATSDLFTQKAQMIQIRPRVTLHGGATKTAV